MYTWKYVAQDIIPLDCTRRLGFETYWKMAIVLENMRYLCMKLVVDLKFWILIGVRWLVES